MRYGNKIKQLIKSAGYGQNEFANKIGVAGSTIEKVLTGTLKHAGMDEFRTLCGDILLQWAA